MQVTHNSKEEPMQNHEEDAGLVNNLICLISPR